MTGDPRRRIADDDEAARVARRRGDLRDVPRVREAPIPRSPASGSLAMKAATAATSGVLALFSVLINSSFARAP